jgi:hypothetical protein
MTPTKQGMFTVRYKTHRCRHCGCELSTGSTAYRVKSRIYCPACADADDRDERPSKPQRKVAPPDPTKGGGAMPGENCATQCADGVWRYECGSVTEAVKDALDDYAQNANTQEYLRGRMLTALGGGDSWANNFTRARFVKELSDPSRHLLEAVDRMRERLVGEVAAPSTPRRRVRRGQEFGEELDSDRYLAHSLSPWDRNVREQQARRTVTIGCNLSVNAGARPEQLLYRGAAALALADILSSRGVNVGIVLFNSRTDPTDRVERAVERYVVKDPLMPLDVSAVAFAMCEIAFFRVVSALGGMRHFPGKHHVGLGCVSVLPTADREGLDYLVEADVLSEDAAVEWLTGCMASQESEVCRV